MMNRLNWVAGSVVVLGGLMAVNGCIIVGGGGSGSGSGSGSGTGASDSSSSGYSSNASSSSTYGSSTSSGGLPSSCTASTNDDACTSCEKSSCCAELTACSGDASCGTSYGDYVSCLFPDGQNASGYSSAYCKAAVGADKTAAGPLIDCLTSKCGTDTACGTEPKITYSNFAGKFMEDYCNGCHFPGYGEAGHLGFINTDDFSKDTTWDTWGPPEGNADWPNQGNYPVVQANGDKIWCGVSAQLPTECATKFPGKFPKAERFPPNGTTSVDHNGDPVHCWWAADGQTCPQPTDVERAQMSSWIFAGMPQ